jgi:hypothetical protein
MKMDKHGFETGGDGGGVIGAKEKTKVSEGKGGGESEG